MRRIMVGLLGTLLACSAATLHRPGAVDGAPTAGDAESRGLQGREVRTALATAAPRAVLSATGGWRLYERGGASVLVSASDGDAWTVEGDGRRLRAVHAGGARVPSREGPFVARPRDEGSVLTLGGRRYRGKSCITVADPGLGVVKQLPVETYLRGVVPLEIGDRVVGEEAAVAAQAVAARSYTYARLIALGPSSSRPWDLLSSVGDQVYGGADAEMPIADLAVTMTGSLVLRYAGRIANAQYHSTCGGTTAEAP